MNRSLIWIALLSLAVVWLSRSGLLHPALAGSSMVNGIVKDRASEPGFFSSAQDLSSVPQSKLVPTNDQTSAPAEASPSVEDDPEKVAVVISAMSEAEVVIWLATLTNQDLTGNTGRLLLRRWVDLNSVAAVNWVAQLGDAGARQELVDVVAVAWSEKDLPQALTWVEALPADDAKHQALADLGYEVARVDPLNALQIATQLPASDYANGLLLHALAQYAAADPGQSQQLALALPPGPLREQALCTVATVQATQDGAGAAQFAVENISPGADLDRAVTGVVQLWAQNDLTAASGWVHSFPASPMLDQALQCLDNIKAR